MNQRGILFRGKRKRDNQWHYGIAFPYRGNNVAILDSISPITLLTSGAEVRPDTVGQWTGLTDRDGFRVFEGDVLAFEKYVGIEELGIVFWDEYHAGFMVRSGELRVEPLFVPPVSRKIFRVVGNIHDNPELVRKVMEKPPEPSEDVMAPQDVGR